MTEPAMSLGTYTLGPGDGLLQVHTGRHGVAARAGHDLDIGVGAWSATLTLVADPRQSTLTLAADPHSLQVLDAHGGMSALSDGERAGIARTIDEKVLKGTAIVFRSSRVTPDGPGRLAVHGELELNGHRGDVEFALTIVRGRLSGRARIAQTRWAITPYSGLMGTLKVDDEVAVSVDVRLPA